MQTRSKDTQVPFSMFGCRLGCCEPKTQKLVSFPGMSPSSGFSLMNQQHEAFRFDIANSPGLSPSAAPNILLARVIGLELGTSRRTFQSRHNPSIFFF